MASNDNEVLRQFAGYVTWAETEVRNMQGRIDLEQRTLNTLRDELDVLTAKVDNARKTVISLEANLDREEGGL